MCICKNCNCFLVKLLFNLILSIYCVHKTYVTLPGISDVSCLYLKVVGVYNNAKIDISDVEVHSY